MAMPLNEGDSATMPVDEEPAPAPAPTISEILAAAVATGGGGAASSNSLMVTAPEEDEYDDDDALSTGSATAVPKEKGAIVKRPWTDEEDQRLSQLVAEHGPRRWPVLAVQMPGREGKQCRERWFNFLRPSVDKSAWTEEEDELIMQLVQVEHASRTPFLLGPRPPARPVVPPIPRCPRPRPARPPAPRPRPRAQARPPRPPFPRLNRRPFAPAAVDGHQVVGDGEVAAGAHGQLDQEPLELEDARDPPPPGEAAAEGGCGAAAPAASRPPAHPDARGRPPPPPLHKLIPPPSLPRPRHLRQPAPRDGEHAVAQARPGHLRRRRRHLRRRVRVGRPAERCRRARGGALGGGRGAGTGKRRAAAKGASAAARDALVADARGAPPVLAYPPGSSGDAIAAAAAAAAAATAAAAAAAIGAHPRSLAAPVARRPRPGHPLERVIAEDAAKNSSPSGMRAAATLFTSAVMRNAAPCAAAPLSPAPPAPPRRLARPSLTPLRRASQLSEPRLAPPRPRAQVQPVGQRADAAGFAAEGRAGGAGGVVEPGAAGGGVVVDRRAPAVGRQAERALGGGVAPHARRQLRRRRDTTKITRRCTSLPNDTTEVDRPAPFLFPCPPRNRAPSPDRHEVSQPPHERTSD